MVGCAVFLSPAFEIPSSSVDQVLRSRLWSVWRPWRPDSTLNSSHSSSRSSTGETSFFLTLSFPLEAVSRLFIFLAVDAVTSESAECELKQVDRKSLAVQNNKLGARRVVSGSRR